MTACPCPKCTAPGRRLTSVPILLGLRVKNSWRCTRCGHRWATSEKVEEPK